MPWPPLFLHPSDILPAIATGVALACIVSLTPLHAQDAPPETGQDLAPERQRRALTDEQARRADALMTQFACVVCAGQSIAESNAEPARRMRTLIIQSVAADLSDQDITDLVVTRYGPTAVLSPPTDTGAGMALWLAPLVILALGGGLAWRAMRPKTA